MSGILFQARNRRGLGHLVRVRNIVVALRAVAPEVDVAVHFTAPPASGMWDDSLPWSDATRITWDAMVERSRPDVVVYDTVLPEMPKAGLATHARVAFVLRRRRETRRDELASHKALSAVDLVLVPHEVDEIDFVVPPELAARTEVVGTIVRSPDDGTVQALRRQLGLTPRTLLVTSTAGGGGFDTETDRFFEAVAVAHRRLRSEQPTARHVIVLGPNHANEGAARALAALDGALVVRSCAHLIEMLACSDLVVAEAGYNTVSELRLCATPSVLLPARRGLDDQHERANRLGDQGAAHVARPTDGPDEIAEAVAGLLGDPAGRERQRAAHRARPLCLGNDRAAALIVGLLQ